MCRLNRFFNAALICSISVSALVNRFCCSDRCACDCGWNSVEYSDKALRIVLTATLYFMDKACQVMPCRLSLAAARTAVIVSFGCLPINPINPLLLIKYPFSVNNRS